MSWFFEIVGVVCCTVWAYVFIGIAVYFAIRPLVYPIERLKYAACWPVAPALLVFRFFRLRRIRRQPPIPQARTERGRHTTWPRVRGPVDN